MEIREFARALVESPRLDEKLAPPPASLTDLQPGPPLRLERPGRPANLAPVVAKAARVPPRQGMADPAQRVRILHALANHELQALELFAWALLAFPEAPAEFRAGLLRLVADEQRHCRAYMGQMKRWRAALGDFPVSGYFWGKVKDFSTPLRFVCGMALTFENANLDHARDYADAAASAGDLETAALLDLVHQDEVEHVRFGWRWLKEWKEPEASMWEAYCANVTWPLRGALARGKVFHAEGRLEAGLDPEFVSLLAASGRGAAAAEGMV